MINIWYLIIITVVWYVLFRLLHLISPNYTASVLNIIFAPIIFFWVFLQSIITGKKIYETIITTITPPRRAQPADQQHYPINRMQINWSMIVKYALLFAILYFVITYASMLQNWILAIFLPYRDNLSIISEQLTPEPTITTPTEEIIDDPPVYHQNLTVVANQRVWICVLVAPAESPHAWINEQDWSRFNGIIGIYENQIVLDAVSLVKQQYYMRVGGIHHLTINIDGIDQQISHTGAAHVIINEQEIIIGGEEYNIPSLCE